MIKLLDEKYPTLFKFFKSTVNSGEIPNSIILYGSDILSQYIFAVMLAKLVNCQGDKSKDCNCLNCNWIAEGKHPAVLTISKKDNKPEGDESKTVISKKQTDMIKDIILMSSDYHRFFIFTDVITDELRGAKKLEIEKSKNFGITLPENWYPSTLNEKCFSDVVANSMLKIIEEPPQKTTFIFLTQSPDLLISTIVSRSSCYYVPSFNREEYNFDEISKILTDYPNIKRENALKISEELSDYAKETGFSLTQIIDNIQNYITNLLYQNTKYYLFKELLKDIEALEKAKDMLKSSVKESIIYENLGYILTKRG